MIESFFGLASSFSNFSIPLAAMNETAWTYLFVSITFMVYLYIGWKSRVQETESFYVAGHGVPAIANGAATAADWMSAASFLGMAGSISFLGFDGTQYLLGWTGGYVLLALLLAPYLRKFGKFTVPDFVGARYYSETARIVAAICAIFISITYVAGQMRGVGIVFARFLQIDIWQGVVLGMVMVGFFAVLGGMKGITWTQVVQYGVLICAFLIPAVAISIDLTGSAVPQVGIAKSDIASKLNQIQMDLGFAEYTKPFTSNADASTFWPGLNVLCVMFALMVGTAGLPHVIVRFYTTKSVRAARWSAGWALLLIAILYTTAPAIAMFARYNLIESLHDSKIEKIVPSEKVEGRSIYHLTQKDSEGKDVPIKWATRWQETGLITFNDADKSGTIQLDKTAGKFKDKKGQVGEAKIDKDIIVLSTPEIANLAPWVIALVATGGLAAALSTAAGLLLVISSSLAHDLYVHFIDPTASEKKRLTIGRIMICLAIVVAGYFGINPPGYVAEVVAFAFGLAAASFFPIILLGIFDKRMNREGAIAGMIVGILFTATYILGNQSTIVFGTDEPLMGRWCFGISPQGIGTVGCFLNFAVALVVSRFTPAPPQEVQDLVESVRVPKGAHEPEAHFDETDMEADNP